MMIKSYLQDIQSRSSSYLDELSTKDGKIAPQWEKLARYYESVGPQKLVDGLEQVSRQLRENGVTYNLYGDPNGLNRPWNLDPIPMIFDHHEWDHIERGLKQRAHLLNHILKDIYGNRKLIRAGLIPFELIYHHHGFLRQADKLILDSDLQLIQYAADLARGSNGKMWVLNDRTDAPSGSGYTLENRAAMTRVFPELLRENEVRRISSYYHTLRNTLSYLSSSNIENPRVVLLTPGPTNETYFEHAYLSSFMGYTLAVGEDLTVSDGKVWLKTIKGLEKVDVIMRRVDDVYCDPLEFKNESQLGVVGLMEAIRRKNVLVINPLGVRVLENPGLMAFLPKLCRHILDEDLILDSVATWWCGHEKEKEYVIENLDKLSVRSIYAYTDSFFGGALSSSEKKKLIDRINADPYLFVGQEIVDFSTTPSWIDDKLVARNAVFRGFMVADVNSHDYHVMQGGLSRSAPEQGVFSVSNQSGGISKDAWVSGKRTESSVDLPVTTLPGRQGRQLHVMPSRTGERLFWLGRYMERSAYTIRLMRMALLAYNEADEDIHVQEDVVLSTLLTSLTHLTGTLPGFTDKKVLKNPEKELLSLNTDIYRVGALAHSIQSFLSNGYATRDRLSLDTWRILESVSVELNQVRKDGATLTTVYDALDNMVIRMMAFYGLNIDNMTRNSTWHLLNMGRFLESAGNSCVLLKSLLSNQYDPETDKELWENALRSHESLLTYRYEYRSNLELNSVLQLLLINEASPRSII
ncbi:MAG: circularly permuted type 2 ATP-grasp protein, partial [Bacteroidota bacterium]